MIYKSLVDVPYTSIRAVIINVETKLCSTLALLSTLRYAKLPVLLIDCEYKAHNSDYKYFCVLQNVYNFDLIKLPLKKHGLTLDYLFSNIKSDKLLLVDSDLELLDSKLVDKMLKMSCVLEGQTFGAGLQHGPCNLDLSSFYDKRTNEDGLYAERMWIPLTVLNVDKIREALQAGMSFLDKTVYNVIPQCPKLSKFVYKHFPSLCNKSFMDWLKVGYGNNKVNIVYYDTGAEIYEYLKDVKYYIFFGDRYESFAHEKHCKHYEGVTRKLLNKDNDKTAFDLQNVETFLINRLKYEYDFDYKAYAKTI